MTDTKPKRIRKSKQQTPADILIQIGMLPLKDKVAVFTTLKGMIQADQKSMEEQIQLITANVK